MYLSSCSQASRWRSGDTPGMLRGFAPPKILSANNSASGAFSRITRKRRAMSGAIAMPPQMRVGGVDSPPRADRRPKRIRPFVSLPYGALYSGECACAAATGKVIRARDLNEVFL